MTETSLFEFWWFRKNSLKASPRRKPGSRIACNKYSGFRRNDKSCGISISYEIINFGYWIFFLFGAWNLGSSALSLCPLYYWRVKSLNFVEKKCLLSLSYWLKVYGFFWLRLRRTLPLWWKIKDFRLEKIYGGRRGGGGLVHPWSERQGFSAEGRSSSPTCTVPWSSEPFLPPKISRPPGCPWG